jgi:hypothetical protein
MVISNPCQRFHGIIGVECLIISIQPAQKVRPGSKSRQIANGEAIEILTDS